MRKMSIHRRNLKDRVLHCATMKDYEIDSSYLEKQNRGIGKNRKNPWSSIDLCVRQISN